MSEIDIQLEQAARLRALVALARARQQARGGTPVNRKPVLKGVRTFRVPTFDGTSTNRQPESEILGMPLDPSYFEPSPDDGARAVAAELLQRIALGADGAPFDDNDPDTWAQADAAAPEIVSLGPVRFRIVDADAVDLAVAVGAIKPGDATLCLRVEFDKAANTVEPSLGQVLAVATVEPGVTLVLGVWATYADLNDPGAPVLGAGAVCNDALDALGPNQALLVQVLDAEELP
ncbi:MAG: hypothetical protein EOO27_03155 [Comamonadaceae bacterium]|nr:MAG: hypothetical protein EOO27_03155 [Comamonadaceae bacterium]